MANNFMKDMAYEIESRGITNLVTRDVESIRKYDPDLAKIIDKSVAANKEAREHIKARQEKNVPRR